MNYVTDTHSLVWYFTENPRLSKEALNIFETLAIKEGTLIVPTVVIAEIIFIVQKGRIPLDLKKTIQAIEDCENFEVSPLDLEIIKIASELNFQMEMHDKLIVSTAIYHQAILITKDEQIVKSDLVKTLW